MATPTYTLLIVEDFPADREQYRRCLLADPSCTYCFLEAESVEEGLELCRTQAIDAILLDYMLPDADGLEFIESLFAQSNGHGPPIVMVTGEGHERIAVQAIKLGAEDYLVKRDLTPERLQSTIRSAIENARLRLQLQQCRKRFQVSVDNMLDCFGIYSAIRNKKGQITDFQIEYLNTAALKNNQMTSADIGKRLCKVSPDYRETGLFEEYCRVVETGEPLVKEDLVYSNVFGVQQLTRAYDVHVSKLDDGFVASWRDITARKQAELRLQENNQQVITIWESMTDAYVSLDRDWRIVYANQAATQVIFQLTDREPEAFLGRTHWEIFPWSVGQAIEYEYRRAVEEQTAVHFEALHESSGNWFEVHAYPSAEGLGVYFRDISERKRIEADRLKVTEERDRFFNLSIDMLAIANFEGYFIRVNPAWEVTLGFTPAEMMAQPYLNFVHPDDLEATISLAQGLNEGQAAISFENRYLCKDGSYRWLLWSAMPYGETNLVYAISHDITERKQAEAAIKDSERKFRAVFDQTFELLGLLSPDGIVLEVNQSALDTVGAQLSDVVGKEFWETPWWSHSPQLQDQLRQWIAQAANGQFIRHEVPFPGVTGELIVVDFSLKALFDEAGQVVMMIAEGRDITDLKKAEQRRQESKEQLRAGVQVAGVALARFDYATNLVTLSPEAAALYGFPLEQLVVSRERVHATFHPDERTELLETIEQIIAPQSTGWFARDHRVVWPNGEVRWLSVRKQVAFDHSGEVPCPSYAILAAIDITERKKTLATLEERNQELNSFVHIVSHDLKAPLRGITNLSQWIEEDLEERLSAESQENMALLRSRVHRMETMIDGLLEYARVGRTAATVEPVAVKELLAEVIDSVAPPPTFHIHLAPNLPTLYTKRLWLSQVFANLIGNGVKHHNLLNGCIRISCHDRGDFYEFVVADDGPGIAPEYHDKIFMIFQVGSTQDSQNSSGIGLSIVKKIVETERGTIHLESEPGKGTTFYFTWPKH
jgi:PAS domain S-box-containing protein